LRFYQLGAQSFWIDEAFSTAQAQAIVRHGYPLLETGEVAWSYFPAHYLMALGLVITRNLEVGTRLFSALAGTLACLAFFHFNWQLTRSKVQALAATSLLSFSTYEIAWSRQARGYVLLQLCGIFSMDLFIAFLREKKTAKLAGALVCAALCPLVHPAGYVFPLALLLLSLPELWRRPAWRAWFQITPTRKVVGLGLLLALVGFWVIAQHTNAAPGVNMRQILTHTAHNYSLTYMRFLHSILGALWWWCLFGAGLAAWYYPRHSIPLLGAAGIYFYLIAVRNPLMHYRYLLPIFPLLLCWGATGGFVLAAHLLQRNNWWGRLGVVAILMAFCCSLGSMDWNVRPFQKYYLGATEPQPEWRAAYAHIKTDSSAHAVAPGELVTISAFPVFHDLYLGAKGQKYFLPVSLTGWPQDIPERASYSLARTIHSVEELMGLKGYVILDEMGLAMLCNETLRKYLQSRKPDFVIPGFYKIYIWKKGLPPSV